MALPSRVQVGLGVEMNERGAQIPVGIPSIETPKKGTPEGSAMQMFDSVFPRPSALKQSIAYNLSFQ